MYLVSWKKLTFHNFPCIWQIRVRLVPRPNASYPSGPSYYPGQGTRKACTLSMEATLLSAQALRMKRQGPELISRAVQSWRANQSTLHALERLGGVLRHITGTVVALAASCLMLFQIEIDGDTRNPGVTKFQLSHVFGTMHLNHVWSRSGRIEHWLPIDSSY